MKLSHLCYPGIEIAGGLVMVARPDNTLAAVPPLTFGFTNPSSPLIFSIFDDSPFANCFKRSEDLTLDQKRVGVSILQSLSLETELQHASKPAKLACFSIDAGGSTKLVFAIFFSETNFDSKFLQSMLDTLKLLSKIMSLYLVLKTPHLKNVGEQENVILEEEVTPPSPMTDRQLLILQLISAGKTNQSIAEAIGYSESTVRQETIKIYSKLHCNGRNEAIQIYFKNFASTRGE